MNTIVKQMTKVLHSMTHRHDLYRVFSDSMEMLALAVANVCDLDQFDAREARYLNIAKAYNRDELMQVSQLLALLTEGMEAESYDFLGDLFMSLELGSDARGQFFTPYSLCKITADLTIGDEQVQQALAKRGYVSVHEPAVGAGGLVLAMEESLRQRGYRGVMHATCMDVDIKAVHMAFLQLSMAGIPAVVVHGNTLTLETWSAWYTPVHIWQGWARKLRCPSAAAVETEFPAPLMETAALADTIGQMDLFVSPAVKVAS